MHCKVAEVSPHPIGRSSEKMTRAHGLGRVPCWGDEASLGLWAGHAALWVPEAYGRLQVMQHQLKTEVMLIQITPLLHSAL